MDIFHVLALENKSPRDMIVILLRLPSHLKHAAVVKDVCRNSILKRGCHCFSSLSAVDAMCIPQVVPCPRQALARYSARSAQEKEKKNAGRNGVFQGTRSGRAGNSPRLISERVGERWAFVLTCYLSLKVHCGDHSHSSLDLRMPIGALNIYSLDFPMLSKLQQGANHRVASGRWDQPTALERPVDGPA